MDIDKLLQQVIDQARAIEIPVSDKILPEVMINYRALSRFGCCRKTDGGFVIEVSARVVRAGEDVCREVLAHEVLHSCYGCINHGARWKSYAKKMNAVYGYNISRVTSCEEFGVERPDTGRYHFRCQSCGAEFERVRRSALVKDPSKFRCRCGGRIERVD